eukprot:CAMPEP_0115194862 /NCGR_PEP_ID=MMETSP0270-20121206/14287_1 /TAXON_ID=71861 /ORGANISM="Scrippsiella trochoidea, Strain CCMP3099" /LENGTH=158 /DNA_ID=CAMNT_0002608173 /DNA_START=203 /DNA_END=679 /DNA_ORIENTATION=-
MTLTRKIKGSSAMMLDNLRRMSLLLLLPSFTPGRMQCINSPVLPTISTSTADRGKPTSSATHPRTSSNDKVLPSLTASSNIAITGTPGETGSDHSDSTRKAEEIAAQRMRVGEPLLSPWMMATPSITGKEDEGNDGVEHSMVRTASNEEFRDGVWSSI